LIDQHSSVGVPRPSQGVDFEPAQPPRHGVLTWHPDDPDDPRRCRVGAVIDVLPGFESVPDVDPETAFWSAAARFALGLVARGQVVPVGDQHWEADLSDQDDRDALAQLAATTRPAGREREGKLRAFVDAVVDSLIDEVAAGLASDVALTLEVTWHGGDDGPLHLTVVDAEARPVMDTALAIRRGARVWPPLETLLHEAVPSAFELTSDDVSDLLDGASVRLAAAGIDIRWPAELQRRVITRAVITAPGDRPRDIVTAGTGATIDWSLELDGVPLSQSERDHLTASRGPLVRLRDGWVLVPPATVERARVRPAEPVAPVDVLGAVLASVMHVDGEPIEVASAGWIEEVRARLTAPQAWTTAAPARLRATLREYQLRGLRWLVEMTELGLGGCLADDMGLGKTVTLIALHLHRQQSAATAGPTLVVCPASLLGNWQHEIERFAPGVHVRRFHGTNRSLEAILREVGDGFVLTTYGTMRVDAASLAAAEWKLAVADEAQHVKNPASSTAQALREIPAAARVALTGTPVENNLTELWAILDWTTPGLLGSVGEFRRRWAEPIESGLEPETADRLSTLVRPFLLRRRKSDPGIAPELPSKTETDQLVPLSTEQVALYEALVRDTMDQIRASSGMARRGLVMKLFTGLKQICNHPAHFLKESDSVLAGRSGKLELLDELLGTILAEGGSSLVFTQYVAMARLLERHLTRAGVHTRFLHGGTPVSRREEMVHEFQAGAAPVFLLSLRAAGTGLNLTRADHVIHYDRWWNPAVEDQATDRAHRIGQTQPVQVHRFIAEGTLEEQIATMLASKRALAESVLAGGEAALTELTDDELTELVTLRRAI
jgi:superfamily II DNA or RNA helicase